MSGRNCERVSRVVDRGTQAADTTIAKVVRVDHRRIVRLVVGHTLDVSWTAEGRVDRHGVAARRAARIGEVVGLVVVRARETTARACLAGAGAREAVAADTILLRRIT